MNGKRMGLRCTPQSTGPRFNPCDVDIVVAILDDCRHRWIGGHNVFEVVFIRKYYNLIEPRRGKTHRCSHRPHPLHLPPHQVRALLSGLLDLLCGILNLSRNKSPKSGVQIFLRALWLLPPEDFMEQVRQHEDLSTDLANAMQKDLRK